jgi:hypothetical protein
MTICGDDENEQTEEWNVSPQISDLPDADLVWGLAHCRNGNGGNPVSNTDAHHRDPPSALRIDERTITDV